MAYRSTLKKREQPVTADDFRAASALRFNQIHDLRDMDLDSLAVWNSVIPYTPLQIHEIFAGAFTGRDIYVRFDVEKKGRITAKVAPYGRPSFSGDVIFRAGQEKSRESGRFLVVPEHQNKGYGSAWLSSQMEFALAFEYPNLKFKAGLDNGASTWAAKGIELDMDPYYQPARNKLSGQMKERLALVKDRISPENYDRARDLCQLSGKRDLLLLAAMDCPIEVSFMSKVDGMGGRSPEEMKFLRQSFERAVQRNKEAAPLFQFLLSGGEWFARIDFGDDKQIENIRDHIGGLKTIERAKSLPQGEAPKVRPIPEKVLEPAY